jgi:hypothetical protein
MSEREIVRRGDAALEWVHRWPEAPAAGATLVVQGHEQAVFVADGAPLGVVGPGRYTLDPAQWPAVAAWARPDGTLHIQVFFVTSGGPWALEVDAPVGAVNGLGAGRAGHLRVTARVGLRVADAVAVVRAVLLDGGDFTARHAAWRRDAGRLLADTVHGMLLQGTLDAARAPAAVFAVGRHALPALRGRLSPDGLDVLDLEHLALVESAATPAAGPTILRIEASVLARALAAGPSTARPHAAPATLRPVLVAAPARVGPLRAGVVTPSHDRVGVRHDQGVPVIALDARMLPRWRGAEPGEPWELRHRAVGDLGVEPWPEPESIVRGEEAAREAYQRCRRHLLAAAPELTARDARATDAALLSPDEAWSEAFARGGEEVAWLSVDRSTEALSLARRVTLTAGVALPEGLRGAAWRPGDAALQCAVVTSAMGEPDGVAVVAGMPSGQTFAGELAGRWERPTATVTEVVDVASGWLVLAWARASGRCVAEAVGAHGEEGWMAACLQGARAAVALPTGLEAQAGGAVAWLLRVRPGTWRVTHHHGTLGDVRLQCLVLAHAASEGWQPAATLHDPAPRDSAPDGALRDREVFPGQPVARVSEYVRMVRGLRADQAKRKETLAALGIELGDFGAVMQRWSRAMMEDHALGREVAKAMNVD